MSRLLPDDSPRTLLVASLLGAASSSCSYAAVALARSLFRKGASFTAAIAFQLASTNLVLELGIIMIILLVWQFAAAEFIGAPIMVGILVWLFRRFLTQKKVRTAKRQADKGVAGSMEGHAEMDMSVSGGSIWSPITSPKGPRGVGAEDVLEIVLPGEPSDARVVLGTSRRAARRSDFVRLFRRQRAIGRRPVEPWHQLRWRDRIHLRGPDRSADSRHLSEVLHDQDCVASRVDAVRLDGRRGTGCRTAVQGAGMDPNNGLQRSPKLTFRSTTRRCSTCYS
jgi:hypothetical protein